MSRRMYALRNKRTGKWWSNEVRDEGHWRDSLEEASLNESSEGWMRCRGEEVVSVSIKVRVAKEAIR
ncbi:MAG: hypothetical protein ABFC80_08085 [Coriobacteriales bacterium]